MRLGLAIAGAAILTLLAGNALAAEQQYDAHLTGAAGSGSVHLDFDTDSSELDYAVTYQGLSGAPTGAGLHGPAKIGDAPLVLALPVSASPSSGVAKLTVTQANELNVGLLYFSIDTPNGQLRGQLRRSQ